MTFSKHTIRYEYDVFSRSRLVPAEYCGGYMQTFCFVCLDSLNLRIKLFTFRKSSKYKKATFEQRY